MNRVDKKQKSRSAWNQELDDLIRGACGGFLFGIPLLYTMEVWWIGSGAEPQLMLLALGITFGVVFLLNRTEGFRKTQSVRWPDALFDSVEAIAIGLLSAGLMLILLQQITLSTQLKEAVGKTIYSGIPFALGATVANQYLSSPENYSRPEEPQDNLNETLSDIGVTLIGAIFIAFNIAPTEEVPMLSSSVSGPWLIAMIGASLLVSYGIVFQASFANQPRRRRQRGLFQNPLSETVISYLISLIAAGLMLGFFEQIEMGDPLAVWLPQTLILGLPASIGGAAGRLVI
ncbi:MAG: TIGR02587 family membrane protein [Leptolyngbyaceae cyanobacterium SL_1_1]|nr:TIGR02587 family membrane protein [Leptolyngbyaceae cyanobacterium RM1_1_2]NJO11411.1 TIGR02587 family membrane protein [Leptolyngbyaceae cyanobacterium SL_1_1]